MTVVYGYHWNGHVHDTNSILHKFVARSVFIAERIEGTNHSHDLLRVYLATTITALKVFQEWPLTTGKIGLFLLPVYKYYEMQSLILALGLSAEL